MGTKLRRFSTNTATKVIAFILLIMSITTAVTLSQSVIYQNVTSGEPLYVNEFKDSDTFFNQYVYKALNSVGNAKNISKESEFYFYVNDGKNTYTNSQNTDKRFFEQFSNAFFCFEKGKWTVGKNTNPQIVKVRYLNMKMTAYIAFPDNFINANQQEWNANRAKLIPLLISIASNLFLAFLLFIFLFCVTGRKPNDKELYQSELDKIYSDVLLVSFIFFLTLWFFIAAYFIRERNFLPGNDEVRCFISILEVVVVTIVFSVINCTIILTLMRKIKARKLLKHSLIFMFFYTIYDFCRSLFDGRKFAKYPLTKSLFYRQVVFIAASAFLVFLTLLFSNSRALILLPPILEIVIIYWYIKGNNKTFEDINKGFNESLQDQMSAERMKIALVTNVSHDLKTPLTSIISYVDLLSKEEDLSEVARDYVKILSEKSDRLKNIVSDLFDLAKSTSGNIALDLESLDMKKLIEQTLADMEDEIEKSGLQIKTKLPDSPVNIISDGKKLYRVFQNVIDNALKYSLSGTRVFVELEDTNGTAIATIKNTASYEMDFTADDILQRFNRGDKSRTSEGSGLGLSIAESFTSVCGGSFKVDIDGDLFKITISFENKSQIAE